ncbi:MAG: hypothetical protein HY247_01165 [archaeon]|nr:MAG: hypothetical protein HY247_01165 [archaeon]
MAKSSTVVGAVVAILIIGAIASIGYYQFAIAPGQNSTTTTSTTSAVTCTPSTCAYVNITNGAGTCGPVGPCGYAPLSVTLVIGVNNTAVWKNLDPGSIHTVTETTGVGPSSGDMHENGAYQYTYATAGTFDYKCIYHAWMRGTVTVKSP